MQISTSPVLLFGAFMGMLALVAIIVAYKIRPAQQSLIGLTAAVLPSFLMLGLFYSLAVHMHQSLGGWPASIGERGLPASLIAHESVAWDYFSVLAFVSIFVWPAAFLLCAVVRRWRVCLYYLGV